MRRPPSVQVWLAAGALLLVATPAASVAVASLLYREPGSRPQVEPATARMTSLVDAATSWQDPVWRKAADHEARTDHVEALLVGDDGRLMYASPGVSMNGRLSSLAGPVADTRGERGLLYLRETGPPAAAATPTAATFRRLAVTLGAGLAALVATVAALAWAMRRHVLRPLAELSAAAREVEAGNLEVPAPSARVLELQAVAGAFGAMMGGLRAARRRQDESEEQRRFVVAAIAHDLRTPLFSLRASLEALDTGLARTPDRARRYVRTARDQAALLERRVGELFELARLDYRTGVRSPERCELAEVIRRAARCTAVGNRALRLEGPADGCVFLGDEGLLSRAAENLFDNAVRHARALVLVSWGCEDGQPWFTVADDGPGLDPSDLPHLFEPLYRGEASRNRHTGGSGLGLAIAQRAVLAHGGRLEARNRLGGGAEFLCRLPSPAEPDSTDGSGRGAESQTVRWNPG